MISALRKLIDRGDTGPPATPARQQLREAHQAKRLAEQKLQEETARLERVEQLTAAIQNAEAAVAAARTEIDAAVSAWAANGATGEPVPQALRDQMAAATRAAAVARTVAESAINELPLVRQAVQEAQRAFDIATYEIREAVCAVMLSESEPHFAAAAKARSDYLDAIRPLWALRMVTHAAWGDAHPWRAFAGGYSNSKRWLEQLAIPSPDFSREQIVQLLDGSHDLRAGCNDLADWGRQLHVDADAQLEAHSNAQ